MASVTFSAFNKPAKQCLQTHSLLYQLVPKRGGFMPGAKPVAALSPYSYAALSCPEIERVTGGIGSHITTRKSGPMGAAVLASKDSWLSSSPKVGVFWQALGSAAVLRCRQ